MLRVRILLAASTLAVASVSSAAPVDYYFEAPPFELPLPDAIPTDDPTFCNDNIRHATTNCGVSFLSFWFTLNDDDIVAGGGFLATPVDFLLWDGATAASPALNFTVTDRIFTADPSGKLNGLLVTVTSALGPVWVPPGTYTKMTMLWYEPTRSFNITGSYCVDLAGCTTDGFAEINLRSHVGEDNYDPLEPAPILVRINDVPEPAPITLVMAGVGAAVARRRLASSAP